MEPEGACASEAIGACEGRTKTIECVVPVASTASLTVSNADREVVANFRIGLPHKKGGGRDDIQLLLDNSHLQMFFPESFRDWTYAAANVANGTATINGLNYPNCDAVTASGGIAAGPGVDGIPCALIGGAQASYNDPTVYTGPVGVPLTAALTSQTKQYFFPNSPTNRLPGANVPLGQRDTYDYRTNIFKAQYQKNIGTTAYFRLYGYSFYSDWLQKRCVGIQAAFRRFDCSRLRADRAHAVLAFSILSVQVKM